jgi:hypothetical protein
MKLISSLLFVVACYAASGASAATIAVFNGTPGDPSTPDFFSFDAPVTGTATVTRTDTNTGRILNFVLNGALSTILIEAGIKAGESYDFAINADETYSIAAAWQNGPETFNNGYQLTVTAVPLPVAAWLFGTAVLGLTVVARRKDKEPGGVAPAA